MKKISLSNQELSRLIRRVVKEEEDVFDLKQTVMDTAQFEEEDIPSECIDDPSKPRIETIQACIGKITEKSTALNNAIKALSDSLNKAKSEASSVQSESRRFRRKLY